MRSKLRCFIVLCLAAVSVHARTIELTLHPAKAPEPKDKYQFLPRDSECSDADAVPFYNKAVQSMPKDLQEDQINQWIHEPLNKLPQEQAQAMLQQLKPTLQLIQQASKCKQCNWPAVEVGTTTEELRGYRKLAFLLALQSRVQIVRGKYNEAICTIKTGFAMAKHLDKAPTLVQGLIGVATAAITLKQMEELIQGQDAPNLYWALQDLPKPFIDLTQQTELEMPEVRNKIRLLMNRLDRHVAVLQCIEALRLYAAIHDGKFPDNLGEINEVTIPDDPVKNKLFIYRSTAGTQAVLEGPIPEGGTDEDSVQYELKLE